MQQPWPGFILVRVVIHAAAAGRSWAGGGGTQERPPGGVMALTAEKIKKTQNSKKGVDNKNIVCYIVVINRGKGEITMKKTALQAANEIRESIGISQKKLAEKMELKSQQAVFNMLNAKNGMRVDNFVKMMEIMGYDVVVRNKVTDEEIEIVGDLD